MRSISRCSACRTVAARTAARSPSKRRVSLRVPAIDRSRTRRCRPACRRCRRSARRRRSRRPPTWARECAHRALGHRPRHLLADRAMRRDQRRRRRRAARSWLRSNRSRSRARTSRWSRRGRCRRRRSCRRCSFRPSPASSRAPAARRPARRTDSDVVVVHQAPPQRRSPAACRSAATRSSNRMPKPPRQPMPAAAQLEQPVGPAHRARLHGIEEAEQREGDELRQQAGRHHQPQHDPERDHLVPDDAAGVGDAHVRAR